MFSITKEMNSIIMSIIINLILGKGSRKKMTNIYEITEALQQTYGGKPSRYMVDAVVSHLIYVKCIRYFDNTAENGRVYRNYGVTEFGWEMYGDREVDSA